MNSQSSFRNLLGRLALSLATAWFAAGAHGQTVSAAAAVASVVIDSPSSLTLVQALRAARDNPDVQLARGALEAARGDVVAADRAPNAVLSLKSSSIDLQNGIGGGNLLTRKRIDKGVGVDWTWERGEKRTLRTRVAQRGAAAAQADLDDTELQQLLATASAWVELAAAQDRLLQVQAIERSALQLADTAQRRLTAGDLSQQDTVRAEIEARRAQADTLNARLEVQRAALALAAIIGGPSLAGAPPASLRAAAPWRASVEAAAVALSASADASIEPWLAQRADIRAARERVDAARAALDGAQALRRADVTWGVSLDHYPGTSTRLLELRMQMPIQSPALGGYDYQGEIARAAATLQQAQSALERLRLNARSEVLRLQQERATAAQRVLQFEQDILPRARRVADSAELAYSKGALSLTDLLDARRTLRTTLLDAVGAHAEHTRADTVWVLRTQPGTLLTP